MSEDDSVQPTAGESDDTADSGRATVLEVFGLKLEVSNPRLADLLTMDAREALDTDVRELVQPSERPDAAQIAEAVPDAVVAASTPHSEADARARAEFRAEADGIGGRLGFDIRPDGLWVSPKDFAIVTRNVERAVSLAAATHFVAEIAQHREALAGPDATALFVVDCQQTADVFKVAIRQRRLYNVMRTISLANLEQIARLVEDGKLDHAQALVLLTPIENIDVGEVLSVIRSASAPKP